MKKAFSLIYVLLAVVGASAAPADAIKAIEYLPPTNFYRGLLGGRNDPGDNPFSLNGPSFLEYKNKYNKYDFISFQFGLAGAYVGKGKIVHFLPTQPSDLKNYLETEYRGKFPSANDATVDKIDGLNSVSFVGTRPPGEIRPYFLCFRWIQIETNIMLKITALSCDSNNFTSMVDSFHSIKIDKNQLLESLKPKEPEISQSHLDKVEIGYMQWRGQRTAALVFRCDGKFYSFAIADGGDPEEPIKMTSDALQKLQSLNSNPNALRMATVEIGRTGDGPNDFQTSLNFFAETNAATIAKINLHQRPSPAMLMAWETWTNREPEGFKKVSEFPINGILFMRKEE